MNVIFMGTPEFSVPVLQGLIDSEEHTVTAVVTQPDKARGRSGKLVFTPVKEVAVDNDIPVYTPVKIKDPEFVKTLRQIPCDVIVVVAFGQILSKDILDMPAYGCINVHASLLPRWRGAAPMQWAILEGDEKTGVTTMQMAEGLDTGDMLLKAETPIEADDTAETLHDRMSVMGKELLLKTLDSLGKGELTPVPQKDEESCYAKMLTKDLGKISMNWNAKKLERYIRGLNSWPSAYTTWKGKTLKLWRAKVISGNTEEAPGTIVEVGKKSFTIQTGDGKLEILEVQLEGKKRMDAGSFLRGVSVEKGDVLC
ncbi:MAG: methionyl-tRNA formyltransferase [Eubacterium sp.]|nr:methionyl-tRNA formyltransferase [Eubacterium sp.]